MPNIWCWITANSAPITAVATVLYLAVTLGIFLQTIRSATAAAKSADSANKSVAAAGRAASVSKESVDLVRKQIDDQTIRSLTAVRTGVGVALSTIKAWRAKVEATDLANMNSLRSLPPTDDLILPLALAEPLALIDTQEAMKLSAALIEMRLARSVIESTRNVDNKDGNKTSGHFDRAGKEAAKHLDAAASALHEVDLFLEEIRRRSATSHPGS
jgi:hypothetical protein